MGVCGIYVVRECEEVLRGCMSGGGKKMFSLHIGKMFFMQAGTVIKVEPRGCLLGGGGGGGEANSGG